MRQIGLLLFLLGVFSPALALGATPRPAEERAQSLEKNLQAFQLRLLYHGPQDKPFYNLSLSVQPLEQLASDPFHPLLQIDEAQAKKIIQFLATDGFLEQATELPAQRKRFLPASGYTLTVNGQDVALHAELGWDLAMLQRLDGLHKVLEGKPAAAMQTLIGRLAGYRKLWSE
ncbi:hypothetical protein [Lignipirellula cremea]|uniref:Uncharacterized protein n=1 Tax=Lignipirellula cremea TaxID=2528010 RepID=A0A518DRJ8_9BACT|nr:hypothetical protein [Lignipirellula cremea]QDU94456.1 hypothetical protein Pla8534_22470 [Lignipirellula cremea]